MKIVWMPYEDANREFLSRMWMANVFRQYGLTSVILPKYYMDYTLRDGVMWPIGAVVHKGANSVSSIVTLDFHGHLNVVIDEETLNVVDPDFMGSMFAEGVLNHVRVFMATHKGQEDAVKDKLKMGHVLQGLNPRLEMLRSPIIRDALPSMVPSSVLINTNVGALNNTMGSLKDYSMMLQQVGLCSADNREDFTYAHYEHDNKKQKAFSLAIVGLKSFGEFDKITVRSHPGESPDYWKTLCDATGVHFSDHSETHLEEISRAEFIIGYRCTTLIEAGFLGRDTFDITVGDHPWDNYYMQHPYSELYGQSGLHSLGKYLKEFLHDHSGKSPHKAVLERSCQVHGKLTERQKNKLKFPDDLVRKVLKNMDMPKVKKRQNTMVITP